MKISFVYDIPTKVYFGNDVEGLGELASSYGKKALLIYDGDYIKKNGLFDRVLKQLHDNKIEIHEFKDVRPNPRHSDINKGVELCRIKQIEVIIAIGGGSVIDSAKAIGSAFYYDGDCWDIISKKVSHSYCLPILAISTISATGSEMDNAAVITNEKTKEKSVLAGQELYPVAAFMEPKLTYTVSKKQTACGVADIIAHILEEYFTPVPGLSMVDSIMEGLVRTMLYYGPLAVEQPDNYEARANIMWSSVWAINGFVSFDRPHNWSMHPLGHELSAYYDLTHGITLAIVMPKWLRYIKDEQSLPLFRNLGQYAFMFDPNMSSKKMADEVISQLENLFYKRLQLPSSLSELNINDEHFEEMANNLCKEDGYLNGYRKLNKEDILSIYQQCL